MEIHLSSDGKQCVLEVVDDGAGTAAFDGGTGLLGIRDRLAAVGGRLEIESRPRLGTRLVASVPQ